MCHMCLTETLYIYQQVYIYIYIKFGKYICYICLVYVRVLYGYIYRVSMGHRWHACTSPFSLGCGSSGCAFAKRGVRVCKSVRALCAMKEEKERKGEQSGTLFMVALTMARLDRVALSGLGCEQTISMDSTVQYRTGEDRTASANGDAGERDESNLGECVKSRHFFVSLCCVAKGTR